MAEIEIRVIQQEPLERVPTIKGVCCREWDLMLGMGAGRCGLCGGTCVPIGPVRY
jgi:hypothetical protein